MSESNNFSSRTKILNSDLADTYLEIKRAELLLKQNEIYLAVRKQTKGELRVKQTYFCEEKNLGFVRSITDAIIERLLNELMTNQDIELKTAPEYVIVNQMNNENSSNTTANTAESNQNQTQQQQNAGQEQIDRQVKTETSSKTIIEEQDAKLVGYRDIGLLSMHGFDPREHEDIRALCGGKITEEKLIQLKGKRQYAFLLDKRANQQAQRNENKDNGLFAIRFDKLTEHHIAKKITPYLDNGRIEGGVAIYGSAELGGGYEPKSGGLSYDQKRALTSSPTHAERFKLKRFTSVEVLGEEIMGMALGKERDAAIEIKLKNLSLTLTDKMYEEFMEELTRYEETSGQIEYPEGTYYYGEGEIPQKHINKSSSATNLTPKEYDERVGKFEDSLKKSTYSPDQIIKFDLLDEKITQKDLARKLTQLIACCVEGKITYKDKSTTVTKRNTRAGNKAYCDLKSVLLFVDWSIESDVNLVLKSPMVSFNILNKVLDIIPCTLANNFQVIAVSGGKETKTIKKTTGIMKIKKDEPADSLRVEIHKHDQYHIEFLTWGMSPSAPKGSAIDLQNKLNEIAKALPNIFTTAGDTSTAIENTNLTNVGNAATNLTTVTGERDKALDEAKKLKA
ncbi:19799_t:CDS:2 [Entrophospora sp. SA101]|nr:14665_t:CDS:2 [Entrophospora sp. SA101]CAJ0747273.1 19799_t:CDS:2 [Entrophospora sp. SA101]